MAHPNWRMDPEQRPHPCGRHLLIHEGRPALVCLGVAIRRPDGGSSPTFRLGRNCSCEPAAPGGHVGLCLQEHTGGIWASGDCDCSDGAGNGGEHHTLACAITSCDPSVCRGVLLGTEPDEEETGTRCSLGSTRAHDPLGEFTRRILRRNRLADYLCDWSGG